MAGPISSPQPSCGGEETFPERDDDMVILVVEHEDHVVTVNMRRDQAKGFCLNEEQLDKTWGAYMVQNKEGALYWAFNEESGNG